MPHFNWIPKSYAEFRTAVGEGRVHLEIRSDQYKWLYSDVLPFSLFRVLGIGGSYEERLLKLMSGDEQVFRTVFDRGVDLVLSDPK